MIPRLKTFSFSSSISMHYNCPARIQRPRNVLLWSCYGQDVPDHIRTKIGRIMFLTYFSSTMFGMHIASGNTEKFP